MEIESTEPTKMTDYEVYQANLRGFGEGYSSEERELLCERVLCAAIAGRQLLLHEVDAHAIGRVLSVADLFIEGLYPALGSVPDDAEISETATPADAPSDTPSDVTVTPSAEAAAPVSSTVESIEPGETPAEVAASGAVPAADEAKIVSPKRPSRAKAKT